MLALYIIAGIVFLFLVLLCVPVRTALTIDTNEVQTYKIQIHWLFGLFKTTIDKTSFTDGRKEIKTNRDTMERKPDSGKGTLLTLLDSTRIVRRFLRLIDDIRRTIHAGTLCGAFTVGFEDPADTGVFFSFAGPVNMFLNRLPKYDVSLMPSFGNGDILEGELEGHLTVYPIAVLFPVIKFGASRDVLRFAGKHIVKKWKR